MCLCGSADGREFVRVGAEKERGTVGRVCLTQACCATRVVGGCGWAGQRPCSAHVSVCRLVPRWVLACTQREERGGSKSFVRPLPRAAGD